MTRREAAQVSLPEFNLRYHGWEKRETREWERVRWIVFHEYCLNPYIKPASKPRRPSAILPLPGDREPFDDMKPEDCHVTEEQKRVLEEMFNQIRQKRDSKS